MINVAVNRLGTNGHSFVRNGNATNKANEGSTNQKMLIDKSATFVVSLVSAKSQIIPR